MAKKACELSPKTGSYWNTLGIAHYRAGNFQEALDALQKSMDLTKGGSVWDWFFLAMAHWRLGHKEEARQWYNKAIAWMDENKPRDERLPPLRAEAAALLEITDEKTKDVKTAPGSLSGSGGSSPDEAVEKKSSTPAP